MAKQSAKNAIVLINGYLFSTYATMFDIKADAGKILVTGFGDGAANYVPGMPTVAGTVDMLWESSANSVHLALSSLPTGALTILPEGGTLGNQSLSFAVMQATYIPKGTPTSAITVGGIQFESYGNNTGIETGVVLQHGTTTTTLTGTGVDDPTGASVTAACGATLHLWGTPLAADTYVIKVQHSVDNSSWADLITFSANGSARTVERQTVASGTIRRYRRVLATRTGSAGNTLGFTVVFYHL